MKRYENLKEVAVERFGATGDMAIYEPSGAVRSDENGTPDDPRDYSILDVREDDEVYGFCVVAVGPSEEPDLITFDDGMRTQRV